MHSQRPQSLKFFWLQYEVVDIQNMIAKYHELDYFVFPFYFPADEDEKGKPLQLISYAYMVDPNGNYYSPEGQVLPVYKNNALELSGPLILSNNIISKADMLKAIGASSDGITPDYLVLIPDVTETNFVYYKFRRHIRIPHAPDPQVPLPGGEAPVATNPSPPATMASE